jgi:hypothetical protein
MKINTLTPKAVGVLSLVVLATCKEVGQEDFIIQANGISGAAADFASSGLTLEAFLWARGLDVGGAIEMFGPELFNEEE